MLLASLWRMPPLPAKAVHHGGPFPSLRSGCVQVIAPPKFALSAADPFNGARSGRTSGTKSATAQSGAGAIKKPPIVDRRFEHSCRSSHHPAQKRQQDTEKCALLTTPSIGLVCGFAQAPDLVSLAVCRRAWCRVSASKMLGRCPAPH